MAEYAQLVATYPGWDLRTMKELPIREREYWLALAKWKSENERWQRMTQPNRT